MRGDLRNAVPAVPEQLRHHVIRIHGHTLFGDVTGNWQRWYRDNIPLAEQLHIGYTAEGQE